LLVAAPSASAAPIKESAALTNEAASMTHITKIRSGDGDTLRAIFYWDRGRDGAGDQLQYWGGSACSATTSDADFSLSRMPAGWNDEVSAVQDFNGCDVKLYMHDGFRTGTSSYINFGTSGRDLTFVWNDQLSSFRVS
jgi:hypothetical protein